MENIFSITEKYDPIDLLIISLIFQTITSKRSFFIGEENGGFILLLANIILHYLFIGISMWDVC